MSDRSNPSAPQIGVGAVVFNAEKVLLIKRGKPPKVGQWSLPGGRQELGETVEQAVIREVMEETGLAVTDVRFLTIVDLIDCDNDGQIRYHYTLIDYHMMAVGERLQAGSDAMDAAWFELHEIETMALWSETKRIIHLAAEQRSIA